MQIRIKTNESLLVSNGWEVMSKYYIYTAYRKKVNNKLTLNVHYNEVRCKITHLDCVSVKTRGDDCVCLKDMEVALEELKKLEIEE